MIWKSVKHFSCALECPGDIPPPHPATGANAAAAQSVWRRKMKLMIISADGYLLEQGVPTGTRCAHKPTERGCAMTESKAFGG
jgi:hypothetical protein